MKYQCTICGRIFDEKDYEYAVLCHPNVIKIEDIETKEIEDNEVV